MSEPESLSADAGDGGDAEMTLRELVEVVRQRLEEGRCEVCGCAVNGVRNWCEVCIELEITSARAMRGEI